MFTILAYFTLFIVKYAKIELQLAKNSKGEQKKSSYF